MGEKMASSTEYIIRCVETIKADKNISEQTIMIMFKTYGAMIINETIKPNK